MSAILLSFQKPYACYNGLSGSAQPAHSLLMTVDVGYLSCPIGP